MAVADEIGLNFLRLLLPEGQTHDITQTEALLAGLHHGNILADKGYDSNAAAALVTSQGCNAVIPARKCSHPRPIDWHLYEERALVGCFFQTLKRNRRVVSPELV